MSEDSRESIRAWTRYSAAALEMGLSVVIGLGIGYWLDHVLGTAPWMALFWMACGTAAGIRSLYRLAKQLEREDEKESAGDKGETRPGK